LRVMPMTKKNASLTAAALLAAATLFASATNSAYAQFQRPDGRALDANRRVGGSGTNDEVNNRAGTGRVTGNQIVTGNVTGGREFRGPVGYNDPSEFSGPLQTNVSDRFVRD